MLVTQEIWLQQPGEKGGEGEKGREQGSRGEGRVKGRRESITGGRGGGGRGAEKRQGRAGSWEVQLGSRGVFPPPAQGPREDSGWGRIAGRAGRTGMDPEPRPPGSAGSKKGIKFLLEEHAVRRASGKEQTAAPTRPPAPAMLAAEGPLPPRRRQEPGWRSRPPPRSCLHLVGVDPYYWGRCADSKESL